MRLERRNFLTLSVGAVGGFLVTGTSFLTGCGSSLSSIRRPGRTRYNTIAHLMLDVELEHVDPAHREDGYRVVDSVIDHARRAIPELDRGEEESREVALVVLEQINEVLLDFGFVYEKNTLFSTGLAAKRIDCNGYTALYLAVADELDLPLKMVRAPAHAFIRWQLSEDEYVNWETTKGFEKTDQYYIDTHNIAPESVGLSALKSLDPRRDRDEILANAFVNSGAAWLNKGQMMTAIERFKEARRRAPYYDAPYFNIGLAYLHLGNIPESITWCEAAIKLNPNHIKSHAILKLAYAELKNSAKSREHYRKVLSLDPYYYAKEAVKELAKNKSAS